MHRLTVKLHTFPSTLILLRMCLQVSTSAMLWGAGTALGEIPPYAFSYHAAKAGQQNEELDKMFGTQSSNTQHGLVGGLVARMKNWMLGFIKT